MPRNPRPWSIDAVFGTGLRNGLGKNVSFLNDSIAFVTLRSRALPVILPSGVQTDSGECLGRVPAFDMTFATSGALKPAAAALSCNDPMRPPGSWKHWD